MKEKEKEKKSERWNGSEGKKRGRKATEIKDKEGKGGAGREGRG